MHGIVRVNILESINTFNGKIHIMGIKKTNFYFFLKKNKVFTLKGLKDIRL